MLALPWLAVGRTRVRALDVWHSDGMCSSLARCGQACVVVHTVLLPICAPLPSRLSGGGGGGGGGGGLGVSLAVSVAVSSPARVCGSVPRVVCVCVCSLLHCVLPLPPSPVQPPHPRCGRSRVCVAPAALTCVALLLLLNLLSWLGQLHLRGLDVFGEDTGHAVVDTELIMEVMEKRELLEDSPSPSTVAQLREQLVRTMMQVLTCTRLLLVVFRVILACRVDAYTYVVGTKV